jgi:hypothetical protein
MGGGQLMTGTMHRGRTIEFNDLKGVQIVIGLVIGFVPGLLYSGENGRFNYLRIIKLS